MLILSTFLDDFSRLLLALEPGRDAPDRLQASLRALLAEAERLRVESQRLGLEVLEAALRSAASSLEAMLGGLRAKVGAVDGQQLYGRLAKSYEQLAQSARAFDPRAPRARQLSPVNYCRNVFHTSMGLSSALLYRFVLDRRGATFIMASLALTFTLLEVLRRWSAPANAFLMRLFRRIARPHEYYRVNSSTWYAWGVLTAMLLFPPLAVQLACVVLGVADPLASLLGRRFGRRKLYRDRSVIGTVTFLVVAFVSASAFLLLLRPELAPNRSLVHALSAALGGLVAETFSRRLDDNLTIPVASAAASALSLAALG